VEPPVSAATQTTTHSRLGELSSRGMLDALDELLTLASGLLPEPGRSHLAAARDRVAGQRFNLVVLGEFKRGKSTLINALLGREVLPTGVVPLTSVVTALGAGDRDRLLIRSTGGGEVERPAADLADYVTEAGNPANVRRVELARPELDHELLRGGLELVDTPGIGSVHAHNTQVARDFLPRVDAALCVFDAGQPLSEAERELLVEAARRVPRLLMVVNKIDHLEPDERPVALDFVHSALDDLLGGGGVEVFPLSARTGEGVAALADRLSRLAVQERDDLLVRSVAGLARGLAADAAQAARFEAHAIELLLEELASKARMFEQRIAELTAASAEAGDLLDRGIGRAVEQQVNEPLREHARTREAELRAALREHVQQLPALTPRDLSAELEAWIDATVHAEFEQLVPRFEAAIADELTELERRYAARVQLILEQVQDVAQDVFGARAADVLPQTGLSTPSRFSFKLKDPEHALDMIVGFGRTITPGALGRRLVIRDAEQRLVDMTDRHAGRLRSELADRAGAAGRQYRRELAGAVDGPIDAIRGAVDRAGDERRRGQQHARLRLDQLAQTAARCERLADAFDRALVDGEPAAGGSRP
jgi:GTPase SAR1 family protein